MSVVENLTTALLAHDVETAVFAAEGKRVGSNPIEVSGVDTWTFPTARWASLWTGYAPSMYSALGDVAGRYDIFHIHELWHYPAYAAASVAQELGVPYIVTMHGGLGPKALGTRAFKKRLYMKFVQQNILENATALHANTLSEEKQVREHGFEQRLEVIPNGVFGSDIGALSEVASPLVPGLEGKRVILFMSRILPSKGLDALIDAFARLVSSTEDVHLVVAGPDEIGYASKLRNKIRKLGIERHVTFPGMLRGERKIRAFKMADVFVLPSHSEGFSVAILEALAAGLPLVISDNCNFSEVQDFGAGIITSVKSEPLADALGTLIDDEGLRLDMGKRGVELVRRAYTWESISGRMFDYYESILAEQAELKEQELLEQQENAVQSVGA